MTDALKTLTPAEEQEALLRAQELEQKTPGDLADVVHVYALRLARAEIVIRKLEAKR